MDERDDAGELPRPAEPGPAPGYPGVGVRVDEASLESNCLVPLVQL